MSNAYRLLNISASFTIQLSQQTNTLGRRQMEKSLRQRIQRLDDIAEEKELNVMTTLPKHSVDKVLNRVICEARETNKPLVTWTSKELRIICYYLRKLQGDETAFDFALRVVGTHWRESFLIGLVYSLMNNWLELKIGYSEKIRSFILKQLENDNEHSERFVRLKEHFDMLEDAGPLRMAMLLIQKGAKPTSCPLILGFRASTFSLPYYSEVILKYVEKLNTYDLQLLEEVLAKHKMDRTRKLLTATLVEQADVKGDEFWQYKVSTFAKGILGDLSLAASWSPFPGATKADVARLRNAKTLVNRWYTKKVIETFFEICVEDWERKQYWLRYVDRVVDFRIVGTQAMKNRLMKVQKIAEIVPQHFVSTYYKQQATALALCIKDKVFVEFSRDGWALSVYNHGHPNITLFDEKRKSITKLDYLRLLTPNLVERDGISTYAFGRGWIKTGDYNVFNDEGRMAHSGSWQSRLNRWMQQKILLSDAHNIPFGSNDDEVFAEPVEKEEQQYFDAIKYKLRTKVLPANIVKASYVVANDDGIFLYLTFSKRHAFIRSLYKGEHTNGGGLVYKQEGEWIRVIHLYKNLRTYKTEETDACFIKQEGDLLLCKTKSRQEDFLTFYT